MVTARKQLSQRADYTHKYNVRSGRHGWLRLTPAYSVKIVEELINKYDGSIRIFDPFCGTATTALSAAYHGHEGVTTDINPFLIWLGQAKTAYYSPEIIAASRFASIRALEIVKKGGIQGVPRPPIHNIERWWSENALIFLCQLRAAIDEVTQVDSQQRTILLVAFCRTLIALSNAAFNHQSMSFKDSDRIPLLLDVDMCSSYAEDVEFVLLGAAENPTGTGTVILGDARNPSAATNGLFHRVITSPPYANRMSYIRELRPYMYWLGFLEKSRDAGELDWLSIGGTWGIATSRLNEWQHESDHFESDLLSAVRDNMTHNDNKNGRILANYVAKYFDDMWMHFKGLRSMLAPGGEIHYIVGNSTFYKVLLPVEQLYAAMLKTLGFQSIKCIALRKRNSKKELIEFDVTATWHG
ncbi:MAG: DNA methyltransferase [Chloroflexi bacterium]|nr:DNA methyltransferase [Chloroflexota bacterium]MCC6892795.1 DNA methyltransferase [Anaerolineae bacterium]